MPWIFAVRWHKTFVPTQPIAETVLRASVLYLALVLLLRFALKREAGQLGMADLLVLVLLGDASQNAMAGAYTSLTDGMVLVLTLVFWSVALNWLSFRSRRVARLFTPPHLPLVREGRMLRRNMQRELITEEELMSQIRLQGVADLAAVRAAYIESDGRISVITREDQPDARGAHDRDAS